MERTYLSCTSLNRREFVKSLGAALVLCASSALTAAEPTSAVAGGTSPRSDKAKVPKVKQWDVITMGNLARNRYWGETGTKAMRSTLCTCTLIQGDDFRLLVDPSLAKAEQMAAELDRRTGLKVADIDSVFVTHHHDDHWFGLAHFSAARWFAAPEVANAINQTKRLPKPVEPASGPIFAAVSLEPTPGHTASHYSLRFICDDKTVVIAGDAVMTRKHWLERQGHHNSSDQAQAIRSIEHLSKLADIVVPGHDNYFLNLNK
jgi:glyoxylase-like metal-dependent hydrolase (beta-lactamase superfamily II)